jgi:ribosomal biogenesis protein LAS1
MRLPRRVPWASVGELEQLCSWIYTNDDDVDSKLLAINRVCEISVFCFCWLNVKQLSAWKNITTLPHALESTLSLLVVIAQDVPQSALSSHLSLRQSYATAIIRLVNGLVDPLQVGAYARSIASIATQLGFPSWLVELRHAATHEDLPSIGLLREAARQVNN